MNSIRQAIEDNAAAREENTAAADRLGEAIRAADFNGHVPDEEFAHSADWKAGYRQACDDIARDLAARHGIDLAGLGLEAA